MTVNKPTAEAFLATVKKSGLVDPGRLQKALDEFQASGGDVNSALAVAEHLVSLRLLSKWQAEKLLQGKHKGFFLGKYRLISLLGKGGMSSVFLAEHILMRRRCAIKVLPTKRVADSSYLARFHREAQAVAALDHPNIVRAYDVDHQTDRDAEIHFLVMEYVEGSSLQELVSSQGPCEFADAVEYARQAALGLDHAHRAGMVHRDIKPGNLLVDPTGTVKLLDLGLARFFSSEGEGTALTIAHDEKVLGTADYLAPEQAIDSHAVDHRADIYSLGCTLFFLLTGRPPFTEGTLAQRLMAHQTKEPPLVDQCRPDTPASLAAILRKMMAKKPEERFGTAAEVAAVLWHWLSDHADPDWKSAHPHLFGGPRSTGPILAGKPRKIPAAQPVALAITGATEQADTQIVKHDTWPIGDLSLATAPAEGEPELSAFLAQVESPSPQRDASQGSNSSTKSGTAKGDSGLKSKSAAKSASPSGPFGTRTKPASSVVKESASGAASNDSAKGGSAVQEAAPLSADPPNRTDESAFPDFDFSIRSFSPPREPAPLADVVAGPAETGDDAEPFSTERTPVAIIIAAAFITLALAGALSGYLLGWFDTGGELAVEPTSPGFDDGKLLRQRTIRVGGKNAEFDNVQAALTYAQKHFQPVLRSANEKPDELVIHVSEGRYKEQIHLDGGNSELSWPIGIVVRGEGKVVLASSGRGPVISLREVSGLTLENLTIDAGSKPIGMRVSGFVTGTRLAKLKFQNFTQAGLMLSGSQTFGTPLAVEDSRFEPRSDAAIGIRLEPVPNEAALDTYNVTILRCQFIGPLDAGISVRGSSPRNVSIRESIFVQAGIGIQFQGAGRWQDFSLANNTFYQCPVGIAFTAMPNAATHGLSIQRNLFVGASTAEAVVHSGYDSAAFVAMLGYPLDGNWSDRPAPPMAVPGEIDLFAKNGRRGELGTVFESDDSRSARFLVPTATVAAQMKELNLSPADKLQPWIGAFAR